MELIAKLLTKALEGEIAAEKRYLAFASHAHDAGFTGVAVLFRGLAQAEAVHIINHKQALEKNNSTPPDPAEDKGISRATVAENIAAAITAENEEITSMYPSFIKEIRSRHGRDFTPRIALLSLTWALEAEKGHLGLLKWAQKKVRHNQDVKPDNFYLCSVCGNLIHSEKIPDEICPVCGHDAHFYNKIPY